MLPLVESGSPFSMMPTSVLLGPDGIASWDYTLSFVVEAVAVPEPASLALLGTGLAGLAAVRRRRIS